MENFKEDIDAFIEKLKKEYEPVIIFSNDSHCRVLVIKIRSDLDVILQLWDIHEIDETPHIAHPSMKLEGAFRHEHSVEAPSYFWIHDITGRIKNKGLGSLLICELIKLCEQQKAPCIKGVLGDADLMDGTEHKERLLHFYKKFGFVVSLNDNETRGEIFLNLL